jgi:hypothetical protein
MPSYLVLLLLREVLSYLVGHVKKKLLGWLGCVSDSYLPAAAPRSVRPGLCPGEERRPECQAASTSASMRLRRNIYGNGRLRVYRHWRPSISPVQPGAKEAFRLARSMGEAPHHRCMELPYRIYISERSRAFSP